MLYHLHVKHMQSLDILKIYFTITNWCICTFLVHLFCEVLNLNMYFLQLLIDLNSPRISYVRMQNFLAQLIILAAQ